MSHSSRLCIEIVGITGIEVMKNRRKICPGSLQKKMIMVGHQTKTVNFGSVPLGGRCEVTQKPFIILLRLKNGSSFIPSGGNVIESTWIAYP
jgi:hypothetical protein